MPESRAHFPNRSLDFKARLLCLPAPAAVSRQTASGPPFYMGAIQRLALSGLCALAACTTTQPPLETLDRVDLERFMGDWYVIANIPTFAEKGAHNAVESYRLDDDGTIATTFTFRKDSFDGPKKKYTPRGFVRNTETNATWGMQFIWPFKGEYLITYLADDYSQTVISRNKLDDVWIMARTPEIPDSDYQKLVDHIANSGYDIEQLRKVPQRWPEQTP